MNDEYHLLLVLFMYLNFHINPYNGLVEQIRYMNVTISLSSKKLTKKSYSCREYKSIVVVQLSRGKCFRN